MRVILDRPEITALAVIGALGVVVALLSAGLEAGCKAAWRAVRR